jgi:MFS family permease
MQTLPGSNNGSNNGSNGDVSSRRAVLFVVAAVQFLTPFMFSAVGVALPAIGREFSATAVELGLIEMIYILAVALFLLPVGRFADIHGRKRVFITGIITITLATIALSLAPTIELFILFRFMQGIGAALITSTSFAILTSVFPKSHLGRAMGIVVGSIYLGISAGPTLAGLMIHWFGWRWIFYSAVPVELTALLFTLTTLKGEWAGAKGEPFDVRGSLLYIVSLFGLIMGMAQLNSASWGFAAAGLGGMGIGLFIFQQWRAPYPLVQIGSVIRNRVFLFSSIATWLNYAAAFGVMFFFSIYLQVVKGVSPKDTGFILVIQPALQAIFAPYAGRLADRYSPAPIATIGMAICTTALAISLFLSKESSFSLIFIIQILMGIGFGTFSTPNSTAVMNSVSPREYGMASAVVATMRTTGMLACMTMITLILSSYMGSEPVSLQSADGFISSMRLSLFIFTIMGLLGVAFSFGRFERQVEKG